MNFRLLLALAMMCPGLALSWDVELGVHGARITGYLPDSITINRVNVEVADGLVSLTYRGANMRKASTEFVLTSFMDAFVGGAWPLITPISICQS